MSDGIPQYRHYLKATTPTAEHTGPYIRLDTFYMAETETTRGQYTSFLAAIDVNVYYAANDWAAMCDSNTPMTGYTGMKIRDYLGIAAGNVSTAPGMFNTSTTDYSYLGINGTAGSKSEIYYANEPSTSHYAGDPLVRENFPMLYVSFYGTLGFCAWIGGMLPTEAQWEYAACKKPNGDLQMGAEYIGGVTDETGIKAIAWCYANAEGTHHDVATRNPTGVGLYDMVGNLLELCADYYSETYPTGGSVKLGLGTSGAYTVSSSNSDGTPGAEKDTWLGNPIYNYNSSTRIVRGSSYDIIDNDLELSIPGSRLGGASVNSYASFRPAMSLVCP
jgi:formylglycine-generating enzyme required for sulfatase activity